MFYRGYQVVEKGTGVMVENVQDFHPMHIFECGQCFRWDRESDGSYTGVAAGRVVNVSYQDGRLFIDNCTFNDFSEFWFDYFDLGRDYSELKKLLAKDSIMCRAMDFGYGIRLLKQEIWETLISFIISSNNHIPRIRKIIAALAEAYGREIPFRGRTYYSFPDAACLGEKEVEEIDVCRGGYRCKYIVQTSKALMERKMDLAKLSGMNTAEARKELLKFAGVGPKVADCVLLYSGTKYDVFPTDVWVKRVMEALYFHRKVSMKELQEFVKDYFGELAGFAQQYLFYYARENKIGLKE